MESPFIGVSTEQWQAIVEKRGKEAFLAAAQWPLSWLIPARRHKYAADMLYETAIQAHEREIARSMIQLKSPQPEGSTGRWLEGAELVDKFETQLLGEYFLLVGYALECVLKGSLLAMLPELVKEEKKLDNIILTHNLRQLCHDCAIELSPEEVGILEFVTNYITWGKYASPTKLEDMPSPLAANNDNGKSLSISNPFHRRREQVAVNNVYQKAYDLLIRLKQEVKAHD